MKVRRHYERALLFLLICLVCMTVLPVSAEEARQTGSVRLTYPVSDTLFTWYRVGTWTEEGRIVLTDEFAQYDEHMEKPTASQLVMLAQKLAAHTAKTKAAPDFSARTDAGGALSVSGLESGLYLMTGETKQQEEKTYVPAAALLAIPSVIEGQIRYDLEAEAKYEVKTSHSEPETEMTTKESETQVPEEPESETQTPEEAESEMTAKESETQASSEETETETSRTRSGTPKTGDETNVSLFVLLFISSGLAAAILGYRNRQVR